MEVRAYPKVNIGLYVGKKRNDGFHEIATIMQKIDCIYDTVNVCIEPASSASVDVYGLEKYCPVETSTVYKISQLWLARRKAVYHITICVEKGIPVKAGFGGGSSDAASVILALEAMTGNILNENELLELAAKVGSDVPFFVKNCKAAFVSGRGEIVTEIRAREDLRFRLVPGLTPEISTPLAYETVDKCALCEQLPSMKELTEMYYSDVSVWNFENSFECVNEKPAFLCGKNEKLMLSGSGSYWYTVSCNG